MRTQYNPHYLNYRGISFIEIAESQGLFAIRPYKSVNLAPNLTEIQHEAREPRIRGGKARARASRRQPHAMPTAARGRARAPHMKKEEAMSTSSFRSQTCYA